MVLSPRSELAYAAVACTERGATTFRHVSILARRLLQLGHEAKSLIRLAPTLSAVERRGSAASCESMMIVTERYLPLKSLQIVCCNPLFDGPFSR